MASQSQLDEEVIGDQNELKATSQISDVTLAIVENMFAEVQTLAKGLAAKTNLFPSQVVDLWTSKNQRTYVKANMWNLYGSYFKEHQKKELARLPPCPCKCDMFIEMQFD